MTRIQHRTSGLSELATLNYQYDHVGNPVSIIREDGSATYFSYDSIYQLTAETQLDSGGSPTYEAEYQYDGAHNRTVKVIDGEPSSYTLQRGESTRNREDRGRHDLLPPRRLREHHRQTGHGRDHLPAVQHREPADPYRLRGGRALVLHL